MTTIIKHQLRASAGSFGGYHPGGWHPRLHVTLVGPVSPGSEVVWVVDRPDGSPWFEHRVPAPVLDDRQYGSLDLECWRDGENLDLDEAGTVPFTLRLVSALDGIDSLLHDGRMTVVALPGDHRYAVDNEALAGQGLLGLDTVDEPDAPRLVVELFVGGFGEGFGEGFGGRFDGGSDPGEVETWRVGAHCFRDGVRFAEASSVTEVHTFTANDGRSVGQIVAVTFDSVRGWNNLAASGWGAGWHLLDQNDGHYEVKLLLGAAVIRVVPFDVIGGRMVGPGPIEPDPGWGAMSAVPDWHSYGDPHTAAAAASIDDVYAFRVAPQPEAKPAGELDDDACAALQAFADRAERLLLTWESELQAPPPFDFGQVLAAEAVLRERVGYDGLAAAVSAVADAHVTALAGEPVTVGALRTRTAALFDAAQRRLTASEQSEEDALAPYRALLAGDKLAVFDDHPADSFVYTTIDRHPLETPEQLAEAEYWFFEGPLDLPSSARVDGVEITGSVAGWRVLGWQFDADGTALAEFETQGLGSSAPKSAFRPPA